MPKVSRETAMQVENHGPVEDRRGRAGRLHRQLRDVQPGRSTATPLLAGLPGDRCQCPHWGYVFKGKIDVASPTTRRGPRRATPSTCLRGVARSHVRGSEILQFQPADELAKTEEVMARNMRRRDRRATATRSTSWRGRSAAAPRRTSRRRRRRSAADPTWSSGSRGGWPPAANWSSALGRRYSARITSR